MICKPLCGTVYHPQFGALAEFERNLIRERTRAGFRAAKARGRSGGRPKSLDFDKRVLAVRLYDERGHTVDEICKMMGISTKTALYKYIEAELVITSKPYVYVRSFPLVQLRKRFRNNNYK